jgi:hypothetical protein
MIRNIPLIIGHLLVSKRKMKGKGIKYNIKTYLLAQSSWKVSIATKKHMAPTKHISIPALGR